MYANVKRTTVLIEDISLSRERTVDHDVPFFASLSLSLALALPTRRPLLLFIEWKNERRSLPLLHRLCRLESLSFEFRSRPVELSPLPAFRGTGEFQAGTRGILFTPRKRQRNGSREYKYQLVLFLLNWNCNCGNAHFHTIEFFLVCLASSFRSPLPSPDSKDPDRKISISVESDFRIIRFRSLETFRFDFFDFWGFRFDLFEFWRFRFIRFLKISIRFLKVSIYFNFENFDLFDFLKFRFDLFEF